MKSGWFESSDLDRYEDIRLVSRLSCASWASSQVLLVDLSEPDKRGYLALFVLTPFSIVEMTEYSFPFIEEVEKKKGEK